MDDLYDKLECARGEVLLEDRKLFGEFLQSSGGKRIVASLLDLAAHRAEALIRADLATEEGRLKAIKTQGIVAGLQEAVQHLVDLTQKEED